MSQPSLKRPRDSQRAKVYRAERFAYGPDLHRGTMTHEEVVTLAAELAERFEQPVLRIRRRSSGRRSRGGLDKTGLPYIGLLPENRNAHMLCHEAAHAWLEADKRSLYAWHGPQWCRVYLMLVLDVLGDDMHDRLRAAFDIYGVDYWSGAQVSSDEGVCPSGGPDHLTGAVGRKTCAWCDDLEVELAS